MYAGFKANDLHGSNRPKENTPNKDVPAKGASARFQAEEIPENDSPANVKVNDSAAKNNRENSDLPSQPPTPEKSDGNHIANSEELSASDLPDSNRADLLVNNDATDSVPTSYASEKDPSNNKNLGKSPVADLSRADSSSQQLSSRESVNNKAGSAVDTPPETSVAALIAGTTILLNVGAVSIAGYQVSLESPSEVEGIEHGKSQQQKSPVLVIDGLRHTLPQFPPISPSVLESSLVPVITAAGGDIFSASGNDKVIVDDKMMLSRNGAPIAPTNAVVITAVGGHGLAVDYEGTVVVDGNTTLSSGGAVLTVVSTPMRPVSGRLEVGESTLSLQWMGDFGLGFVTVATKSDEVSRVPGSMRPNGTSKAGGVVGQSLVALEGKGWRVKVWNQVSWLATMVMVLLLI
ncbi:uncharacterized protein KY384_004210 [Bacidia gigantensis]|uniref:uncharacterized protein n=1 Tax=Bacidia gigantensis TaxID=2732470 RepID=UPI001D052C41|nr:uncharacterized protein KY384_004210 [Bacidia gigantensis]KAG8530853.1 hypothetical protein KY384_004210 [Bacidia gigantensis]